MRWLVISKGKKKKVIEIEVDEDEDEETLFRPPMGHPEWKGWVKALLDDPNSERRNEVLGTVHDVKELQAISRKGPMTYGQINDFSGWCARQGAGVDPPYELLRVMVPGTNFGVALPWFTIGWIIFTAIISLLGLPLKGLFIMFLGGVGLLLIVATMGARDKFGQKGECHNCGFKPIPKDRATMKLNSRGFEKKHSDAGLCHADDAPNESAIPSMQEPKDCEWILHRYDMASTERNWRWDTLKLNRIRGIIYKVYRDFHTGIEYTKADRKIPRDESDDAMMEKGLVLFHQGIELFERVRRKKRFSIVKGNFTMKR